MIDMNYNPDGSLDEVLAELLANVIGFYLKAHVAHWNVVGENFVEYHALYQEIYEDVYGSIDPLAENIRKLGAFVPMSISDLVTPYEAADLPDCDTLTMDLAMHNRMLIEQIVDAFDVATRERQQGIANFLAERQDMHQKWQWQLTSTMIEVEEPGEMEDVSEDETLAHATGMLADLTD